MLLPLRARLIVRGEASTLPLSAALPPEALAQLDAALDKPLPLPKRAVDELVASPQMRESVRTMLTETLSGFASKLGGSTKEGEKPAGFALPSGLVPARLEPWGVDSWVVLVRACKNRWKTGRGTSSMVPWQCCRGRLPSG